MVARTRQPIIECTRRCALLAHQAEAALRGAGLGLQDMATRAFWAAADVGIERERLSADLPTDTGREGRCSSAARCRTARALRQSPAMALLDAGDGLGVRHRRVVARHPDDNSDLQAVLVPAPRPGPRAPEDFAVVRCQERRPLLVTATRLAHPRMNGPRPGAAWVVKIRDPERRRRPDLAVLQPLFGLTPAKAAVVSEMLPPPSEAAAARAVASSERPFAPSSTPPTARSASTAATSSCICWRATGSGRAPRHASAGCFARPNYDGNVTNLTPRDDAAARSPVYTQRPS
jgi:hypothetical protein